MTREEAIDIIKCLAWHTRPNEEDIEQAIKALEKEPSGDAISREDTKKFLYERIERLNDDELYDIFSKIIDDMYNELPSVNLQEPKMGHWIEYLVNAGDRIDYKCENCGCRVSAKSNFCPNCGCAMVEPQESEDKE